MRIDELRSTLHDHAETVHDLGAPTRVGQVHRRVRTVRRRRTAALAAAAAIVTLAGVVALPPLLDRTPPGPADAPRTLAGHDVPTTEVAAGFTYRYVEGVEGEPGENPLKLEVEVEDRPRLVAFASSDEGSTLTLSGRDGEQTIGAASGEFDSYMLLESSGEHRLRLRQDDLEDGSLALAVYDLVETPPDGVTDGVRTFRQTVPGYELVDGVIGKPGETDLTTTVVLPEGPLQWNDLCLHGGEGLMARIQVVGRPGWWGAGCGSSDERYEDPSASYGGTQTIGTDPTPRGVPVDVRIWLGRQEGDDLSPVDDPDAVLGLAVYSETGDRTRVLGEELQEVEEHFGHAWRLADVREGRRGERIFRTTLPASDDTRVVSFVVTGLAPDGHRLFGGVEGGEESGVESSTGSDVGLLGASTVLPGEERRVFLEVERGATPDTTVAMVTWERAD
ncbi:MAG TPA: hypothetical protein VFG72_08025 [Marmoricola sp.]|nr:hypothetical protein [Marmoricola sp.]